MVKIFQPYLQIDLMADIRQVPGNVYIEQICSLEKLNRCKLIFSVVALLKMALRLSETDQILPELVIGDKGLLKESLMVEMHLL
jgi:hypothetical protein